MYRLDDEGFDIIRDSSGEWEGINGYDEEDTYPKNDYYETNEEGDCIIPKGEEYDSTKDSNMVG